MADWKSVYNFEPRRGEGRRGGGKGRGGDGASNGVSAQWERKSERPWPGEAGATVADH